MEFIECMFLLFISFTIISWVSAFITSIFQPNRFKKNNNERDRQDWEQGWPF
jgi:hypothetical protein